MLYALSENETKRMMIVDGVAEMRSYLDSAVIEMKGYFEKLEKKIDEGFSKIMADIYETRVRERFIIDSILR